MWKCRHPDRDDRDDPSQPWLSRLVTIARNKNVGRDDPSRPWRWWRFAAVCTCANAWWPLFLERRIFTQGVGAHYLKFTSAIPFRDMTSCVIVRSSASTRIYQKRRLFTRLKRHDTLTTLKIWHEPQWRLHWLTLIFTEIFHPWRKQLIKHDKCI